MNPLSEIPVFKIVGKTLQERSQWMCWLRDELGRRCLKTSLFLPETGVTLMELYEQARRSDIILVDSADELPLRTIRLSDDEVLMDDGSADLFFSAGSEHDFILELVQNLIDLVKKRPVWACILIGGKSSRMGRPKHLIEGAGGKTWLEQSIETLRPLVDGLVLSGGGTVPKTLADVQRLPDIPGVAGPLTGILAAMRWQPGVSWLLLACDMPLLNREAVEWLLQSRQAGQWGQVPRLKGNSYCEPLFAWYDIYAAYLFEEQALNSNLRPGMVARHEKVNTPEVPESLRSAWENVNTPAQLYAIEKGSGAGTG